MKFRFAVLLSLILLTASSRGMAGKNPPHPIRLHVDVTLNGAQVPEGVYDLTWDSNSSAVRVTLRKDGQFIATAPGVWVKNGAKYTEDAVLLRVNNDGTRSLIEIRLAGLARTIVLVSPDSVVQLTRK
jgi:hypothetical protein